MMGRSGSDTTYCTSNLSVRPWPCIGIDERKRLTQIISRAWQSRKYSAICVPRSGCVSSVAEGDPRGGKLDWQGYDYLKTIGPYDSLEWGWSILDSSVSGSTERTDSGINVAVHAAGVGKCRTSHIEAVIPKLQIECYVNNPDCSQMGRGRGHCTE